MKKALLLLFVAFSGNSFATFLTGNDLYTRYQAYVRSDNGTASREDYFAAYDYMGYVTGVWDTLGSELICPQGSITRGQIADVVGMGLQKNPQTSAADADKLTALYLMQSFPCKK